MKKIILTVFGAFFFGGIFAQINVQWESRYNAGGGNTPQYVSDMFVDPAGSVYVTGSSYSVANGYDFGLHYFKTQRKSGAFLIR